MDERIVVSPADGVFVVEVTGGRGVRVCEGDVIGHVLVAGRQRMPVVSPFAGELVEVVAWDGERVQTAQRIAWLRAAA